MIRSCGRTSWESISWHGLQAGRSCRDPPKHPPTKCVLGMFALRMYTASHGHLQSKPHTPTLPHPHPPPSVPRRNRGPHSLEESAPQNDRLGSGPITPAYPFPDAGRGFDLQFSSLACPKPQTPNIMIFLTIGIPQQASTGSRAPGGFEAAEVAAVSDLLICSLSFLRTVRLPELSAGPRRGQPKEKRVLEKHREVFPARILT